MVDDSATARVFTASVLTKAGYEVETANNIWISSLVSTFHPDLILMDVHLGPSQGTAAVKALNNRAFTHRALIVLYSTLGLEELEREVLELRRELSEPVEPLPGHPFDVLEVRVGDQWYALPVTAIREVLPMMWAEPLPDAPEWVLGTFRYGGESVPLIDLGRRLFGDSRGLDPERIVVLVERPVPRGFAAEELRELVRVEPREVTPPAAGIPQAPFLLGSIPSGDGALLLLSPGRLGREIVLDVQTDATLA